MEQIDKDGKIERKRKKKKVKLFGHLIGVATRAGNYQLSL